MKVRNFLDTYGEDKQILIVHGVEFPYTRDEILNSDLAEKEIYEIVPEVRNGEIKILIEIAEG